MARKNPYRGVLRPLPLGKGSPEVSLILIYDIEIDRLRTRVSELCLDYGLERVQFSAFFGRLNRNRRQELALRIQREIGPESARIRIIPICADDLADMWTLEQYRLDADDLAQQSESKIPKLKILGRDKQA